jgi:hypothetical protein
MICMGNSQSKGGIVAWVAALLFALAVAILASNAYESRLDASQDE